MKRFLATVRYLLRSRRNADELDEEMRLHIELRARRLAESGAPEKDAMAEARRRFGSKLRRQEESREARVGNGLETIFQDVHYALRLLRRTPLFTVAAISTLALGIGANTAIFTMIDAYLLRPLPVHEPSRLVQLSLNEGPDEDAVSVFPYPALEAVTHESRSTGGWFTWNQMTFSAGWGVDTERIPGAVASGEIWRTLGIAAQAGRLFGPEDDTLTARPVAVISDGYWNSRYHRSRAAIGSTIPLAPHAAYNYWRPSARLPLHDGGERVRHHRSVFCPASESQDGGRDDQLVAIYFWPHESRVDSGECASRDGCDFFQVSQTHRAAPFAE